MVRPIDRDFKLEDKLQKELERFTSMKDQKSIEEVKAKLKTISSPVSMIKIK